MKRIVFILVFLTAAWSMSGCKKDVPVSNSLAGTWELSADINGLSGKVTYHKPGNDTLAKFTATTYAFYQGKTLVKSGNYTVKQDTFYVKNKLGNRIIFDGVDSGFSREFFDIQNNELNLYLDAYDAGGVTYKRVK